jgi:hypothetical protein
LGLALTTFCGSICGLPLSSLSSPLPLLALSFSLPLYPYDQNQIHQVLSSDKVQRINTPIVQLHFRTTTQTNNEQEKSQVLELDKSELETVIASLEEAKEALARLNDTNSKK